MFKTCNKERHHHCESDVSVVVVHDDRLLVVSFKSRRKSFLTDSLILPV